MELVRLEVLGFDDKNEKTDLTSKVNQWTFYYSLEEVANALRLSDIDSDSV